MLLKTYNNQQNSKKLWPMVSNKNNHLVNGATFCTVHFQ